MNHHLNDNWKCRKQKQKSLRQFWSYILKLYNILVQICFATSKIKLSLQHSKLGILTTSRGSKQLKTQDLRANRNIKKSQIWAEIEASVQSPSHKLDFELGKVGIRALQFCTVLMDFLTLFQIFCPKLWNTSARIVFNACSHSVLLSGNQIIFNY